MGREMTRERRTRNKGREKVCNTTDRERENIGNAGKGRGGIAREGKEKGKHEEKDRESEREKKQERKTQNIKEQTFKKTTKNKKKKKKKEIEN
jgi:hypothetical protein